MKIKLRLNPDDQDIVEIWNPWSIRGHSRLMLMAIFHEEHCDKELGEALLCGEWVEAEIVLE